VKALSGCTSDEIPGIPGVGEKTAIKYLSGALKSEHKTFQSIVQNQALFQRNLALVTLPHPETSPLYVPEWKIDLDQCHAIFQEFNMQSMMEERQWMDWKCLAKGNWPYAGAGLTRILSSQVLNSL
jgi:5'-3' exonuclease